MVASLGQANSTPLFAANRTGEMLPGFGDRSNLPNLRSQLLISVKGQSRAFFWRKNCPCCSALPSMPGSFEPNPLYDHFKAILRQELFGPWSGVIFRSVSPRYARPADIASGYGSYRAGGRWNAPGIYAIYGSIEPGLAADESFNFLLQHFGWQNRDVPPRMVVAIRVSLQAVLDLTNPASVLPQLNLEELLIEDWRKMNGEKRESRSQALGRAVADLGEGILAPSHIRMGNNLVLYPRSLKPGSKIEVLGEQDLPE
jgi:RES domain-containing protein